MPDPTTEELDELPRDFWFNPYRVPKTERAWAVVNDVLRQVRALEEHRGLRKRARRTADDDLFRATIAAIVAELIHLHLSGRSGGLVVTRSKDILGRRIRYRPAIYNKTFPTVLDRLSAPEMAFLSQVKGAAVDFDTGRRLRTTIRPGKRLVTRIQDHALTFEDLTVTSEGELIVLKDTPDDYWDEAHLVDYEETQTTSRYRAEMRSINEWLSCANIGFDPNASPEAHVDLSDRRLRRIFTRSRFESGGRLFGGFWQPLKKAVRLKGVRINSEPVVGLDYAQMNPMIAYGFAKTNPSMQDLYAVPGHEAHRDGLKKLFNAMLFASKPLKRMPKGVRRLFPKQVQVEPVMQAIVDSHPGIAQFFYTGLGHHLQFIESEIMVRLLLDLRHKGITALPVHDAVVVQRSKRDIVREAMIDQFRAVVGINVEVTEEALSQLADS